MRFCGEYEKSRIVIIIYSYGLVCIEDMRIDNNIWSKVIDRGFFSYVR